MIAESNRREGKIEVIDEGLIAKIILKEATTITNRQMAEQIVRKYQDGMGSDEVSSDI
jgi:hypothetical protein